MEKVIAVIGAGISGLAAAYEALERGYKVILFEAGVVGGMVQSRTKDGFTLEDGPNVVIERPELSRFINLLGLRGEVVYPSFEPYEQYVWWNGKPHLVPKSLVQLLSSDLFSTRLKFMLPFRLFRKRLLRSSQEDESVLAFFSRLLGNDTTKALLDPVLKGIYGGEVAELSARTLFPKLWEAAQGGASLIQYLSSRKGGGTPKVLTFRGGIQTLTDSLWGALEARVLLVRDRVVGIIQHEQGGFQITTAQGGNYTCHNVLLTPAGKCLASLVQSLAENVSKNLSEMQYASLAMCHVGVRDDVVKLRKAFGVLFPGGMKHHLLGVMYKSIIFPGTAPPGRQLLSVVFGGAQAGDFSPNEEELWEAVQDILHEYFQTGPEGADLSWLGARVWKEAIPQLSVGHHKKVAELDALERERPGLVVCGVDRGGVGISDRIRAGISAVERLDGKC